MGQHTPASSADRAIELAAARAWRQLRHSAAHGRTISLPNLRRLFLRLAGSCRQIAPELVKARERQLIRAFRTSRSCR